jgi:hypothetical protein
MKYAVLNTKSVLIGYETSDTPIIRDDYIEVPAECTLELDKYKWDTDELQFKPMPKINDIPLDRNAVRGIYEGFKAIRDSGLIDLPSSTNVWIERNER